MTDHDRFTIAIDSAGILHSIDQTEVIADSEVLFVQIAKSCNDLDACNEILKTATQEQGKAMLFVLYHTSLRLANGLGTLSTLLAEHGVTAAQVDDVLGVPRLEPPEEISKPTGA